MGNPFMLNQSQELSIEMNTKVWYTNRRLKSKYIRGDM